MGIEFYLIVLESKMVRDQHLVNLRLKWMQFVD